MESASLDATVLDIGEPLVWMIPLTSIGLVADVPKGQFVGDICLSAS